MVKVRVRPVYFGDVKEKGLFANKSFRKGEEIISFRKPKRIIGKRWYKFADKHNLPHDSCVFVENSKGKEYAYYDKTFITNKRRKPLWYYINHSYNPNIKVYLSNKNIRWYAKCRIKKGEEMRFHYGGPLKEWDINE